MVVINKVEKCLSSTQINLQSPLAIAIVSEQFTARCDIIACIGCIRIPPTCGNTNLRILTLKIQALSAKHRYLQRLAALQRAQVGVDA